MPRLGADGAPPVLPITSLLLGALAVAVGGALVVASPSAFTLYLGEYRVVGLNHLFVLLFVGLVFAGTLQQLPAVMFVTKLVWPRLGWVTLPLLFLGSLAVVVGFFRKFDPAWLAPGAAATSLAWLALFVQLVATAAQRWPKDPGSHALILSTAFLALAVTLGFTLASARTTPAISLRIGYPVELHFTVGLFGAFLLGIVGSGQKLLSMFALSKGGPVWRVRWAILAVSGALLLETVAALWHLPLVGAAQLLLAAGAALQLLEVVSILKRRLRKKLEAPIRRYVLAHAFLPLAGAALLLGEGGAAVILYLVGFIGLAVSGMLVKILSFLTWTWQFAGASTGGVSGGAPLLRELVKDELEPVITWGLAAAALTLAASAVWRVSALATFAGLLIVVAGTALFAQACHVVWVTVRSKRRLAAAAAAKAAAKAADSLAAAAPAAANPAPQGGGGPAAGKMEDVRA